jgi:hypothetical protein
MVLFKTLCVFCVYIPGFLPLTLWAAVRAFKIFVAARIIYNPGRLRLPDFASLHPGYILSGIDRFFSTQPGLAIQKA